MIIRKTRMEDFEQVMLIYERAAHYMAENGNPNQWPIGYPTRSMILEDINRGVSYVMEEEGIEAVFSYMEGPDPTYGRIDNGAWKSFGTYGTMHRLASAGKRRGIAGACFAWCAAQAASHGCRSLRADTHADNKIMQHVLMQNGFAYCGIIYLANGEPRLAYERVLWQQGAYNQYNNNNSYGNANYNNNSYGNANYNNNNYGNYNVNAGQLMEKGDGVALGVASMVMGIISVLMFCTCINFPLSIVAIILGIIQIVKNKEKGYAIAGIITSAISIVLGIFLWLMLTVGMVDTVNDYDTPYDSYYYGDEFYYDDYYYDDYYYDDYYYDDYYNEYFDGYDYEEGVEFL